MNARWGCMSTVIFKIECNFCKREIRNLKSMVSDYGDFHPQCHAIKDYIRENLETQRSIIDPTKSVGEISFPIWIEWRRLLSLTTDQGA